MRHCTPPKGKIHDAKDGNADKTALEFESVNGGLLHIASANRKACALLRFQNRHPYPPLNSLVATQHLSASPVIGYSILLEQAQKQLKIV
ncbi:MAG: hypothetical protein GY789_28115 [Hyphomicrobiales bacterium]|nr:hypothetical protein [Hyphomicrobiales bacterium]